MDGAAKDASVEVEVAYLRDNDLCTEGLYFRDPLTDDVLELQRSLDGPPDYCVGHAGATVDCGVRAWDVVDEELILWLDHEAARVLGLDHTLILRLTEGGTMLVLTHMDAVVGLGRLSQPPPPAI